MRDDNDKQVIIGWKTWLFFVMLICFVALGFLSGYLTSYNKNMNNDEGVVFHCWRDEGCNANITIGNMSIRITSDFNAIKFIDDNEGVRR